MADSNFTFEQGGKTYTFEKSLDSVRSPRWLRANRRRDEVDLLFTMLEEVAGAEALEAVDSMTSSEFEAFAAKLNVELSGN